MACKMSNCNDLIMSVSGCCCFLYLCAWKHFLFGLCLDRLRFISRPPTYVLFFHLFLCLFFFVYQSLFCVLNTCYVRYHRKKLPLFASNAEIVRYKFLAQISASILFSDVGETITTNDMGLIWETCHCESWFYHIWKVKFKKPFFFYSLTNLKWEPKLFYSMFVCVLGSLFIARGNQK